MKSINKVFSEIDFTPQLVKEIIHWLKTNELPAHVETQLQHDEFARHFSEFRTQDNKLFYNELEVIPDTPTKIRDILTEVYKSPEALGKGQNALHKYIQTKYIGITRAQIVAFLKLQIPYQLGFAKPRIVNRGIVTTEPFQTWSYDLIDMSSLDHVGANKHFTFILSIIDLFSRYCWLVPLRRKESAQVKAGFESVVAQNKHVFDTPTVKSKLPGAAIADNGQEFEGEMAQYLRDNGVAIIHTPSYTPEGNVEQQNGTVRRDLRALFLKTNSLNWLPHLSEIALSINTNFHQKLHASPLQVMQKWFSSDHEFVAAVAERSLAKKNEKFLRHFKQSDFKVGDHVRVRMASLHSNLRARIKAGIMKKTIVNYSPTVYRIDAVFGPAPGKMSYSSFIVKDKNGNVIIKADGTPHKFRGNELIHTETGYTVHHEIDQARADYLNQVKESSDVVQQAPEPIKVAKVKVPKPPIPFQEWKGPQWTDALKSNLYDFEGGRYEILKVEYDRKEKRYSVISADFRDVDQGKLAKKAETFAIDLALCLSLCRNQIWYTADMESYVKQYLPEEAMNPQEIPLKEPEEMNEPLQVRNLDLEKSKARRNLFGISGGHIRCNGHRSY
jgi:hypothetical protein